MKIASRLIALFVSVVAIFCYPTSAGAGGGTTNGHFKDLGAGAYFRSADPSGCIVTEVFIFATQHYFQSPPGRGITEPFVSLDIFQNDVCAGTQLFQASGGTTTNIDLQVDRQLNWATLSAVVPVFETFSDSLLDIYVDLAWTAVSPRTNQNDHQHIVSPGCHMMFRSNGIFRSAQASGSVSDGVTNYTPETVVVADIFSTKRGNLIVGCQ
jgi:hypothetical protein